MTTIQNLYLYSQIDDHISGLPIWISRNMFRHYYNARSTLSEHVPHKEYRYSSTFSPLNRWIDSFRLDSLPRSRPELLKPFPLFLGISDSSFSYQPHMYFFEGAKEAMKRPKIPYLIEENTEKIKREYGGHIVAFLKNQVRFSGKLRQNRDKMVYLEIDNRFIHTPFSMLQDHHIAEPPYFHLYGKPNGAHITVITKEEVNQNEIREIQELNQEFCFEIEGLYSLQPETWNGIGKVWFLRVKSLELETLRKKYRLFEKLGAHDFHITVAILHTKEKKPLPPMRISRAYLAA